MNAFDFDNTLYFGESSVDFVLYLCKRNKKILLWIPKILSGLVRYKMCLISKAEIEKKINAFLASVLTGKEEIELYVKEFWEKFDSHLNRELLKKVSKDDVIITASPSFILDGIKSKLITSNLICSEFDFDTKSVLFFNFGENKVLKFREIYGDAEIDSFYTDSYNDKAFMKVSNEVYLVRKNRIKKLK